MDKFNETIYYFIKLVKADSRLTQIHTSQGKTFSNNLMNFNV